MERNTLQSREKITTPLFILTLLIVITLGTSVLPASWLGVHQTVRKYEPLNLGSLAQSEELAPDTDNDGTVSWKEYIAHSLNVQPESLSASSSIDVDPRAIASLNDPNNLTSSFTKNLYIASTAFRDNGIDDATLEQNTMNQLLAQEAKKVAPTSYTQSDVTVGSDDSKTALKIYGNSVASILHNLITEKSITDDLMSVANFAQTKNEGGLAPLMANEVKVNNALNALRALPVPKSATLVHVDVLNTLGTYANTLRALSGAYDDPMRATFAIKEYTQVTVGALRIVPQLGEFFNLKNIVFSSKESGHVYTVGYTETTQ